MILSIFSCVINIHIVIVTMIYTIINRPIIIPILHQISLNCNFYGNIYPCNIFNIVIYIINFVTLLESKTEVFTVL